MAVFVPPAGRVEARTVGRGDVVVAVHSAERLAVRVAQSVRRVTDRQLRSTLAYIYHTVHQSAGQQVVKVPWDAQGNGVAAPLIIIIIIIMCTKHITTDT